jgi:hypothetical protein
MAGALCLRTYGRSVSMAELLRWLVILAVAGAAVWVIGGMFIG